MTATENARTAAADLVEAAKGAFVPNYEVNRWGKMAMAAGVPSRDGHGITGYLKAANALLAA